METIYIVDFLNVFSDFREMRYKLYNIDWKDVMHSKFEKDLNIFFKWFFEYYVIELKLEKKCQYVFVMKHIGFQKLFQNILQTYSLYDILFLTIDKQQDNLIDKNKDDFLCKYLYCLYKIQGRTVHLISNDLYRDFKDYFSIFKDKIFGARLSKISNEKNINIKINHIVLSRVFQKIEKISIKKEKLKYLDYFKYEKSKF